MTAQIGEIKTQKILFCESIEKAIVDEKEAKEEYQKIKEKVPYPWITDIIEEIRKDEEDHAGKLENLKKSVCK